MHGIPLSKTTTTVPHIKSTANVIRGKYIRIVLPRGTCTSFLTAFWATLIDCSAESQFLLLERVHEQKLFIGNVNSDST